MKHLWLAAALTVGACAADTQTGTSTSGETNPCIGTECDQTGGPGGEGGGSGGHNVVVPEGPINACGVGGGIAGCEGNGFCESCLVEGECADGPDPIWVNGACACVDNNPANCQYPYCCALNYHWDTEACDCEPDGGGEGSGSGSEGSGSGSGSCGG